MKKACSMSNEEAVLEPGIPLNRDAAAPQDSAGALLRDARQSQGLDIATLAALLKVPVHKLQALEQDQPELLADPVFARALAASMCRLLKLDPALVLHRLPAIAAFKVTSQNRGINTPFRDHASSRNVVPFWSHMSRPAVLMGLVLLLGALVLMFLPSIQKEIARYRQAGQLETVPGQAVESVSATTTTVITPTSQGNEVSGASSTLEAPESVSSAATEAVVSPLAAASPDADSASSAPPMTISAKGASKIKVTDASGKVVLDRTLRAGESVSLSGVLPLAAVVSRANVIQVQVRGQAFDLASVTKNNIARFEVK
jgi:cytoskeleton protein RodZ